MHRSIVVGCVLLGACRATGVSTDDAGAGGAGAGSLGGIGGIPSGSGGPGQSVGGNAGGGGSPAGGGGGPNILTVDAGTATTLATGKPADIAVDGTYVYWTDTQAKTVMKVPKSGGQTITLASGQGVGGGLAVDAAFVYWTTTEGSVMKVPVDGGTPITIASQQRSPNSLALALGNLYWANAGANFVGTGSVMEASLATGEVVTLAANRDGVGPLVVDATSVYWIENGEGPGGIERLPLAGGTVESIGIAVQGSWPVLEGVAVGAGKIFWSVYIQPNGGHRVMQRALAGGPETTLVSASHGYSPLVADGLVIYAPEGRTILRIAEDGLGVAAIPTDGTPSRIALFINDAHIYFTTAEGAVMVMAKP